MFKNYVNSTEMQNTMPNEVDTKEKLIIRNKSFERLSSLNFDKYFIRIEVNNYLNKMLMCNKVS